MAAEAVFSRLHLRGATGSNRRMKHKNIKIAVTAFLLCGAAGANAQIRPAYGYPSVPQGGTQLGETPAYGSWWVGTGVGYDDNLFMSNALQRSSGFYVVSP